MKLIALPAFALAVSQQANAEVFAQFNFDGNSAASSDSSIYTIVGDWDLSNSAAGTTITGSRSSVTAVQNTATTLDPTNVTSQWQQFSFTVTGLTAGQVLNLTSFDYTYDIVKGLNFQSAVYSSLSGYTGTGDSLGTTSNVSGGIDTTLTPSLDLTGNAVFSGLENGDVVEFRIYLKDSSGSSSRIHRLDNIVVNGDVAPVPEPAAYALALAVFALLVVYVRGRKA